MYDWQVYKISFKSMIVIIKQRLMTHNNTSTHKNKYKALQPKVNPNVEHQALTIYNDTLVTMNGIFIFYSNIKAVLYLSV